MTSAAHRTLIQELLAHYGELRRHLARELRDPHQAADIAQGSFERVYRQTQSPDGAMPVESPRALLFRVARNLCIDEARHRQVAQAWAEAHAAQQAGSAAPSAEQLAAQREVLRRVIAVLERLPPLRREVFVLFRAHGFSRAEIAARLGLSEAAVAKHLVRAAIDCGRVFAELSDALIAPQPLPVGLRWAEEGGA